MRLNLRLSRVMRYKLRDVRGERPIFFTCQQAGAHISYRAVVTIGHAPVAVKFAPVRNMGGSLPGRENLLMRVALCTFGRLHAGVRICL